MMRRLKASEAKRAGAAAYDPRTGCDCPYPETWIKARRAWHDGYFEQARKLEQRKEIVT